MYIQYLISFMRRTFFAKKWERQRACLDDTSIYNDDGVE